MKLSEIARYWAARELTRIERNGGRIALKAPFAAGGFTVKIAAKAAAAPRLVHAGKPLPLREVARPRDVEPGTWLREEDGAVICFDLPKGETSLEA
jgi:hypothetical protein